jgi:hypothetical protein
MGKSKRTTVDMGRALSSAGADCLTPGPNLDIHAGETRKQAFDRAFKEWGKVQEATLLYGYNPAKPFRAVSEILSPLPSDSHDLTMGEMYLEHSQNKVFIAVPVTKGRSRLTAVPLCSGDTDIITARSLRENLLTELDGHIKKKTASILPQADPAYLDLMDGAFRVEQQGYFAPPANIDREARRRKARVLGPNPLEGLL